MPNHIRNVLKFKNLTEKEKDFILDSFTTRTKDDVIYPLNRVFDFNKIIPEPKLESECPEDCKVNKDSHVQEEKDRPWFDWYAWRNKYWGTKWNAYDSYTIIGKTYIKFIFSTAWQAPMPIYKQLVKSYYPLKWEVKYADEDIGVNCGHLIYDPDKTGFSDICVHDQHYLTNPEDFARRLWRDY